MSEMYERILALCRQRGIKPGRVCADTGLSRGMMTDLKMGRTKELSAKNTKIIADYFGVTADYLLGKEQEPFEVGDSFLDDHLTVTGIEDNGDGTFNVSFRANVEGIDVEELKKLMNFMIETGISTEGLFELVEAAEKINRRSPGKLLTPPQPLLTPQKDTDTTPALDTTGQERTESDAKEQGQQSDPEIEAEVEAYRQRCIQEKKQASQTSAAKESGVG